jgi:protein involved in polysaccharide export with SLBB domain
LRGASSYADLSRIELIPEDGSKPSYFHYDEILGEAILKGDSGKTLLKPGDRVRVHESRFVGLGITLKGAVMNDGFQPFPLDGRLDLVAAIARAGGFNRHADQKKVFLTRDGKTLTINAMELIMEMRQVMLQPGDLIEVAK